MSGARSTRSWSSEAATGALGVTVGQLTSAPSASLINWFGAGQNLANSAIVPLAAINTAKGNASVAAMGVWIVAGTPNVSATHYIVDCFGYIE